MPHESEHAAMREALEAALQSHVKLGKAYRCECSLCTQIREALACDAGRSYSDRIREECAQVADWKADQLRGEGTSPPNPGDGRALAQKAAREIGDRIRALKGRLF